MRLKYCLSAISQGWSPQCDQVEADAGEWGVLKAGCVNHGVFRPSENKRLPAGVQPPVDLEVTPGDLLVSRANTRQLLGSAALATPSSARLLLCDKLYRLVANADVLDRDYLARAFASAWVRHQLERDATGTSDSMQNTSQQSIRELELPIPQPEGQRVIVDFLDRETKRIDALISKKQQLIELLQEKRTALTSHAVTKGLNPDAPVKESGIEWLGEVPADWQVMSLSRVTKSRCDGPFGSGLKSDHYTDAGRRVIRLQNIASGRFDHRDRAFVDEDYYREHLGEHDVLPGDVLIAGLGDETHPVGRACVMPDGLGDAMVKADCFRFRLDLERAEPHFLALQLSATAAAVSALLSSGATRTRVNMTTMATRSIAVPPLSEQRAIVSWAEAADGQLERLTSRVTKAVERLQEYRSALITAVVTGQIDAGTFRRDPEKVLEAS